MEHRDHDITYLCSASTLALWLRRYIKACQLVVIYNTLEELLCVKHELRDSVNTSSKDEQTEDPYESE